LYEHISIDLPVNTAKNKSYKLNLDKSDIIPASGLKVQTSSGLSFLTDSGKTFVGRIEGDKKSFVVFTVFQNYITGLLQNENGITHSISPNTGKENQVILQQIKQNTESNNYVCSTVKNEPTNENFSNHKSNGNCNQPCAFDCSGSTTVHVYYEMDYIAFLDEGNIQNCINFMTSTHAVIHNIYNNITNVSNNDGPNNPLPGGVNMIMSGLFIWDTPDPYPNGSLNDRINEFVRLRPTFNGDVAHLISKGTVDDGGIASVNLSNTDAAICMNGEEPTVGSPHSLSFLRTANNIDFNIDIFSYGTALIAHEIGHTLGGRHTHEDRWYPDGTSMLYSIQGGSPCEFAADRIGPCTFADDPLTMEIEVYSPTIMSRCWDSGSTGNTIDYSSPFHREVAANILTNLCDNELCYEPPCEEDNDDDFDGYCNDDIDECAPNNPNLPAAHGTPCNDNNPMTVDDIVTDDNYGDPDISCSCEGTIWVNDLDDECNILIGGDVNFDQDFVGQSEGTWYNAIRTGWTGPPGNTPDICHATVDGICNRFIGLQGTNNETSGNVTIKEGIAFQLSDPLPCNTGRLQLTISYASTLRNRADLVIVQGSNQISPILPQICNSNLLNDPTYCFGTFLDSSNGGIYNGNNPITDLMNSDICETPLRFFSETVTLNNLSENDINIIYISFNINPGDGYDEDFVFLDNISMDMDPDSYGSPSHITAGCDIQQIQYSRYCTYDIQYEDPQLGWTDVEENSVSIISSEPSRSGQFKMTTDVIDFSFYNCFPHRIVQNCPPSSDEEYCDVTPIDVDISNCFDNDLSFTLSDSPDEEHCAFFDDVTVYIPGWPTSGYTSIWHDGVTNTTQRDFSEATPGTYTYAITVTEESTGCTGSDDIEVEYVDCSPPPLMVCGTTVDHRLGDQNQISLLWWIENRIPHTSATNNNGVTIYTVESLDFWVGGNVEVDVDITFSNCNFYMSDGFDVIDRMTSSGCTFVPCEDFLNGPFHVRSGAELYLLDNTLVDGYESAQGITYSKTSTVCINGSLVTNYSENLISTNFGTGESIIMITDSQFSNSKRAVEGIGSVLDFIGNNIDNCDVGLELEKAETSKIIGNEINTLNETLILNFGTYSVEENVLESSGSYRFSSIQPSVVKSSFSTSDFLNNILTRNGQGTGIQGTGNKTINAYYNDIEAGGSVTFNSGPFSSQTFNYPAIDLDGASGEISNNFITSDASPGITISQSPSTSILCNDITANRGSRGAIAVSIQEASDNTVFSSNSLDGYRDLITESTIDDPSHQGNCFNGDGVQAILSNAELLTSTFFVDPIDNPCYLPPEDKIFPREWFVDQEGSAARCDGTPGAYELFIHDSTRVCQFLALLDNHLQDADRRSIGIMRMINLFRLAARTAYYENHPMPKCLTDYLDTTHLCGIKLLLQMDTLVENAITGTDKIRNEIQIQSTLTYWLLQQWIEYDASGEGQTQEEKDRLRSLYIRELRILQNLIESQRSEEDALWTEIDSIEILECLDSISMIEMKAYKYLSKRNVLTESEIQEIVYYAKKCTKEYGRGVHLMRAIAANYTTEDYRLYDLVCEEQIDVEKRYIFSRPTTDNRKAVIIPNPNNGKFVIHHDGDKVIDEVTITNSNGTNMVLEYDPYNKANIKLSESLNALYFVKVTYTDGTTEIVKMIYNQ